MKLAFTKPFIKAYRKLPQRIRKATDKQLELLLNDPNHPSLNMKKMNDPREIWETRVTDSYRMTFHIHEDIYLLRMANTTS